MTTGTAPAPSTASRRSAMAPIPARPEHIDAVLRVLAAGPADDHAIQRASGLAYYARSRAVSEARQAGLIAPWRPSRWYAGIWRLTPAGRERLAAIAPAPCRALAPLSHFVSVYPQPGGAVGFCAANASEPMPTFDAARWLAQFLEG